jgi:hypothetical protein
MANLAYWQNERRSLYGQQKYWTEKLNEPRGDNPYYFQDLDLALERLRELDLKIHCVEREIDQLS